MVPVEIRVPENLLEEARAALRRAEGASGEPGDPDEEPWPADAIKPRSTSCRIFSFHLIRGPRAAREDFLSHDARGIPPRSPDDRSVDLNRGVSLLDTLEGARRLRELLPRLGAYAAKLEIPPGVRIEATLWEGHYTVWADPDDLLGWVVEIVSLT